MRWKVLSHLVYWRRSDGLSSDPYLLELLSLAAPWHSASLASSPSVSLSPSVWPNWQLTQEGHGERRGDSARTG